MASFAATGRRVRLIGALLACAAVSAVAAVHARPDAARPAAQPDASRAHVLERSVKAAFLYKFLGYTEFPANAFADAAAPVVIGVIGADDVAAELARVVSGRSAIGRPVTVRVVDEGEAPGQVHLLFVGGTDSARVREALRGARGSPMLLVTETEHGLLYGSVINFRIVDERVRFDVSLEAADRNSVKLSSRLLTVANNVFKGAP